MLRRPGKPKRNVDLKLKQLRIEELKSSRTLSVAADKRLKKMKSDGSVPMRFTKLN